MKKTTKTIKLDYLLAIAVKDYSQTNKCYEIDIIEKALRNFFEETKEKESLKSIQNYLELISNQNENILNKINSFEV
ncbi:hypothetical protein [Methylotenera sp. 1P/1]|uniref:hypothetical protein n=1 Tax=Methylotenera sp. 1P/1 TaxID=1131551 RepID=UPI000379AE3C|nr:hypothetical protein [Methylotenera sp. 1P/1]